ncbi:MAG: alternate-type signal peptide domain-containing protein [Nocardioidaceae bacterium]|nr:alternate-type signal peptide domain-containing protein [Nocardioidaceae bacterium]
MNKSTKGALAAAAAGTLLLGGAGSLAFWTSQQTVDGTSITSGHLKLNTPDCGQGWTLDGGDEYTDQLLVPGDSLTQVCTFTVDAAGEHLTADFDVTGGADTGAADLLDETTVTATYKVTHNGTTTTVGTSDVPIADGDTVTVDLKLNWPYGSEDNDSNVVGGLTESLSDITVTATQHHS